MKSLACLMLMVAAVTAAGNDTQDCEEYLPNGTKCPEEGQFLYPDEEHCSKYWECWEGCAHHMLCQGDYLYDIEHQWCNFPDKVTCGDRDCDSRDCADNHVVDFECPAPWGYFPDPENCMKYYQCESNSAFRVNCPVRKLNHHFRIWIIFWYRYIYDPFRTRQADLVHDEPDTPVRMGRTG